MLGTAPAQRVRLRIRRGPFFDKKAGWRGVTLGLLSLALSIGSPAQVLLGTATSNGNGTYTYAYTVDNVSGAFAVASFTLDFTLDPSEIDWDQLSTFDGGDVQVPSLDWYAVGDYGTGPSSQGFLSQTPSSDVPKGATLSGFSFVSAHPPGTVDYLIEGPGIETALGNVAGPVAVPEPSTLGCLTGLGLLGWVIGQRRIRGARRRP